MLAQVQDGVVSQSSAQAQALWQLREGVSEALAHEALLHKDDVAVPVADVAAFHRDVIAAAAHEFPALELFVFGHLGDGNLHVNLRKPDGMDAAEFRRQTEVVDQVVWDLVGRYRGSLSAEHGIGLLKKKAVPRSRSPREIEIYRAIKRAFDPRGLLNPGKVFDLDPAAPAGPA